MKKTILGLRMETPLHVGTGQNSGVIDLPIQREGHTGYPCIYGSSIKGAFRAHAEVRAGWGSGDRLAATFGSSDQDGNASQISMTDARLLLLPVRSLTGHFKLVTCPAILHRLQRDMSMMGMYSKCVIPRPNTMQVISANQGDLFLEEFKFEQVTGIGNDLITLLNGFGMGEGISEQLIVMSDDDFVWFANNATVVTPHIAIENRTKTVKPGALWYEESLPADAWLYTMLIGEDKYVDDLLAIFSTDSPFIQIGGNETVGMGWCRVEEVSDANH